MRTQVFIVDAFNRDTAWITQEVIEDYIASQLRGSVAAEHCLNKWSKGDAQQIALMRELLDGNPDCELLREELLDEFGELHFVGKPRSKEYHIRQLEMRIEAEQDGKTIAALIKELRELREWTVKPADKAVSVNVNNTISAGKIVFDRGNIQETERIVMSVFGSL